MKLDENLPGCLAEVLRIRGHDVDTVEDEGLCGRGDADVAAAAVADRRAVVTMDKDFSDVRVFVPEVMCGVLMLRLHGLPMAFVRERLLAAVTALESESVEGALWVVGPSRMRRYRRGPLG